MENYKESCRLLLHKAAEKYKKLLGKDFIIESRDFKNRKRYILRFYEGNFLGKIIDKTKIAINAANKILMSDISIVLNFIL